MLMLFCHFRLKIEKQDNGLWYRPATGTEDITVPGKDDCEGGEYVAQLGYYRVDDELVLPIQSLSEVREYCKGRLRTARVLFGVMFLATILAAACTVISIAQTGMNWVTFIPLAVLVIICVMLGPQTFNPVIYDVDDHWVSLRTGRTNLNNGCKIGDTQHKVKA